MAPPLDFNATLAEQLRDAGMQMRAMTKPQKQRVAPDTAAQASEELPANVPADVSADAARHASQDVSLTLSSDASSEVPSDVSGDPSGDMSAATTRITADETLAPTVYPTPPLTGTVTGDTATGVTVEQAAVTPVGANTAVTVPNTVDAAVDATVDTAGTGKSTPHSEPHSHHADVDDSAQDGGQSGVQDSVLGSDHSSALGSVQDSPQHSVPDSHASDHTNGLASSHTSSPDLRQANSHTSGHANGQAHGPHDSHAHASQAGADAAPSLPDAASELWAMSHHSEAPTLSERSWTGGVRGAVLDALRGLAGGRDHVLVNLKRLATHTGISYGSVRNAMSRLTRSGDIRTRQIRMADGHGVRVEFLTLPGQEGTGVAMHTLASSQAAILGQAGLLGQAQHNQHAPFTTPHAQAWDAQAWDAHTGEAQTHSTATPTAHPTVTMTAAQYHAQEAAHWASPQAHGPLSPSLSLEEERASLHMPQGVTPAQQFGQQSGFQTAGQGHQLASQQSPQQDHPQALQQPPHGGQQQSPSQAQQGAYPFTLPYAAAPNAPQATAPGASHGLSPDAALVPDAARALVHDASRALVQDAARALGPDAHSTAPSVPSFWDTEDSLFAVAWPHVATAGLRMAQVRALAPIFSVQGFDPAVLPRTLRYLDWELEQLGVPEDDDAASPLPTDMADAARQHTQAFLRALQRRGTWPRPVGYEEGDD